MSEKRPIGQALVELPITKDMAETYQLTPGALIRTMMHVMPHDKSGRPAFNDDELLSCMLVAQANKLNPVLREIFFTRNKHGQIVPIVSVDGWITRCNEHPQFDGIEFESKDDEHGQCISMICRIWRKDRSKPIVIEEWFDECSKGGGPVWKTNPRRMMRNRTLVQCARVAFGMSGIMELDEYNQWQGRETEPPPPTPINIEAPAVEAEPEPERKAPRDGGPLPRRKRVQKDQFDAEPTNKAALDALIKKIKGAPGLKEVQALFDRAQRDGIPWEIYPAPYAEYLQTLYAARLEEVTPAEAEDEIQEAEIEEIEEPEVVQGDGGVDFDPVTGEIYEETGEPDLADIIERRLEAASTIDELQDIKAEASTKEAWDRVPEDRREDLEILYYAQKSSM